MVSENILKNYNDERAKLSIADTMHWSGCNILTLSFDLR